MVTANRSSLGSVFHHRERRRYIVQSDELLTAFLEVESMLL
jgi:hypothetical protein